MEKRQKSDRIKNLLVFPHSVQFNLRIEKWRNRKYSLYKFTFIILINKKKVTNKKKNTDEQKIKAPKVRKRTKKKKKS